jgi:predicted phosphodiesterase
MSTVLVISDLHLPFQHADAFAFLEVVSGTFQPDTIVSIGDIVDAHALSRYDHDPDGMSPGDEIEHTIYQVEELEALFPNMSICLGNHDLRAARNAYKSGLPVAALRSIEEIYQFPEGWQCSEYFIYDDVVYEHGDRFGAGAMSHLKATKSNMRSTVIGHTHVTFGVEYLANRDKLLFAANTGCLVDARSYAMAYGRAFSGKPILGCLVVKDGYVVLPIPMLLGDDHKWIGKI